MLKCGENMAYMAYIDSYLSREAEKFELSDFYDIYSAIPNNDLRKILLSLYAQLNHWFVTLDGDLRTRYISTQ